MKREILILLTAGIAAQANAGGVFELVAVEPGPYVAGQTVTVEVWLHNEETFGIDLRLVGLDIQGLRARLFAGGDFVNSSGTMVNHVAKLSGGSWTPLDTGLDGPVFALQSCTVGLGTTLYAGGRVWGATDWEATVNRLEAGWWTEIGRGSSGRTLSFLFLNDASGDWLNAGGYLWDFAGVGAYGIARWNGNEWSAVEGLNGSVRDMVIFDDGTGPSLHVAGNFPNPIPPNSNVALRGVAKWTGAAWAPLGGGMMTGYEEWAINALAVFDDGSGPALYAAGDFRDVYLPETDELMQVNNIAKWEGLSWTPVGGGTTPGSPAPIFDMVVHDDGVGPALYVGGRFTNAGGVEVNNIARWDGGAWSDVAGGVTGGGNAEVRTLAVLDGGFGPVLFAGGRFTNAGGVPVANVATWNGTNWSPVGAGFDDTVRALAVHETHGDPNLIIEGFFQFDFSTLSDGGAMNAVFPELPGPLLIYTGQDPIPGSILHLPAGGSLRIGTMEVVTPTTPGPYRLDVASAYGPRGGSILAFGFGTPDDPYTDWLAAEGELTGNPIPLVVQGGTIPATSAWGVVVTTLLLTSAGTVVLTRRRHSAVVREVT
jgi:hypothetical protein